MAKAVSPAGAALAFQIGASEWIIRRAQQIMKEDIFPGQRAVSADEDTRFLLLATVEWLGIRFPDASMVLPPVIGGPTRAAKYDPIE